MLIMSILFIILAVAVPTIDPSFKMATPDMGDVKTYIPDFNLNYFATISMLVFAVGGAEKISPYVNSIDRPTRTFESHDLYGNHDRLERRTRLSRYGDAI